MKVLVVTNMSPFIRGDAEEFTDHLVANLQKVPGVSSQLMRIPIDCEPYQRVIEEVTLCRMLQIDSVDRVIALKFPTYLIPNENKTLWMLNQYKTTYDLYGPGYSNSSEKFEVNVLRQVVETADNICFQQARAIFAASTITRDRLLRYNGFDSIVLPPPLNDPDNFTNLGYADYVFAGGRVNRVMRQHVLVEALRYCRTGARLIIAGPPDSPEDERRLRAAASDPSVSDRVTLDLGFPARAKMADYVNHALACAYLPFDEDWVGQEALGAFQAEKPVVTTSDSGGVLEIVVNNGTGLVVRPDPRAIADAIDRLFLDRERARRLGRAARDLLAGRCLTWSDTVTRLLS